MGNTIDIKSECNDKSTNEQIYKFPQFDKRPIEIYVRPDLSKIILMGNTEISKNLVMQFMILKQINIWKNEFMIVMIILRIINFVMHILC